MLYATGIVLLLLGIFCGGALVLGALGLVAVSPGLTLWILFPAFGIVGYFLAAAAGRDDSARMLTRVSGIAHSLLGLAAAVGLVLHGAGIQPAPQGTFTLWYVLAVGLILGTSGLAAFRPDRAAAPATGRAPSSTP